MAENILEIKNLVIEYKTEDTIIHALNGVDLMVKKGETIGHLLLMRDHINIASFDVTVSKDVEALSFVEKWMNQLKIFV